MTLTEFKKVANLLKQAYREVEAEALTAGIGLMSEEYDQLIAKTRELVITSSGFTVEDFDQLKTKINSTSKVGMYDYMEKVKVRIKNLEDNYRHSTKEIEDIARKIASEFVKPPQIINQIVKEVTIEKPQIIKETTVEKTVETIDYNDEPLKQELETLRKQITDIPRLNEHQLKEDMKGYFNETLKENINILGMPDFRKLAMGLQAQIDALRDNPGTGGGHTIQDEGSNLTQRTNLNFVGSGVSVTDDSGNDATKVTINLGAGTGITEVAISGTVNDSNVDFTASEEPIYLVINGKLYKKTGAEYTWSYSAGDITLNLPIGTGGQIWGIK